MRHPPKKMKICIRLRLRKSVKVKITFDKNGKPAQVMFLKAGAKMLIVHKMLLRIAANLTKKHLS